MQAPQARHCWQQLQGACGCSSTVRANGEDVDWGAALARVLEAGQRQLGYCAALGQVPACKVVRGLHAMAARVQCLSWGVLQLLNSKPGCLAAAAVAAALAAGA